MELNSIHNEDCRTGLQRYPDGFFHCCVTSPPYWGLRDYGVDGQLGLEGTPEEYVANLVQGFNEVKRVLRNDGTLWLNVGDSYANGARNRTIEQVSRGNITGVGTHIACKDEQNKVVSGLKRKDLVGIPWMLAFALRADGWFLRQDIIWHKPNPMPEPVKDRCTKAHEYVFLLSKSDKYYYNADAIATATERGPQKSYHNADGKKYEGVPHHRYKDQFDNRIWGSGRANKRSVWEMSTSSYDEAHFATFPEELPHNCILAGCPEGGNVLDPFMGAGTTGLVARKLQRNYVGFELNPEYIAIADRRLRNELGMFL